ncbi:LysM peptidoglycan-binding domain-containing M23 family metallopeptidase [Hyphococcus sp.]|uniref:LysM peptidoglycan-binding domain-containing M23 family metallopeptidase n=1 Tax=Hyphococcus sp. TaxID=2038636 RepID=UPI002080EC68|nr:MAG: hypothetical protein DHS20C04_19540 [Marinicaulis sp.]
MKTFGWVMISGSFLAAAACGSHNHAPVVYGSDPARQARVYHSPEDMRREQYASRAQAEQAPAYEQPVFQQRSSASIEPVQLAPVSAVYLDEPQRQTARATGIQQASAVSTPPAHLHKAKGYIQVERGDTVYAIARKFNVAPSAIIDENDLKKPYSLQVGQALKLPNGAAALAIDAPSRNATTQPVSTRRVVAQDKLYQVRGGDTLYSISRSTGVPVSNIASANRLSAPYALNIGQQLLIPQAPTGAVAASRSAPAKTADAAMSAPEDLSEITRNASYTPPPAAVSPASMFEWPVRGAIVSEYGSGNLGRRNDGVNIAAPVGAPVRAAADGQVVYRGSELEGFGNLLLIKHRDGFVTAYAHNDSMLVKKGDQVRKGQLIAKVGATGAVTTSQLHFEIRQESQAVDPVALLGKP